MPRLFCLFRFIRFWRFGEEGLEVSHFFLEFADEKLSDGVATEVGEVRDVTFGSGFIGKGVEGRGCLGTALFYRLAVELFGQDGDVDEGDLAVFGKVAHRGNVFGVKRMVGESGRGIAQSDRCEEHGLGAAILRKFNVVVIEAGLVRVGAFFVLAGAVDVFQKEVRVGEVVVRFAVVVRELDEDPVAFLQVGDKRAILLGV